MTTTDIKASRKKLAEDLMSELHRRGHEFPYERIHAGDWQVVIDQLMSIVTKVDHPYVHRALRLFARHALACPGEVSLLLPLLQAFNECDARRLSVSHWATVSSLAAVARPLNQQEVDELVRGISCAVGCLKDFQSVAERGYAPSIDVENELMCKYEGAEAYLLEIRQMQPRWHAMRLQAEMRDLTPVKARASKAQAVPGL